MLHKNKTQEMPSYFEQIVGAVYEQIEVPLMHGPVHLLGYDALQTKHTQAYVDGFAVEISDGVLR